MSGTRRFLEKRILITGGSSGIGLATARRLSAEGASLIVSARNEDRLGQVLSDLPAGAHHPLPCDLSNEESVQKAFESAAEKIGRLDALVLSAGTHLIRPAAMTRASHFRDMFAGNVETATNVVRAAAKFLKSPSSIVLVSSAAAIRGTGGAVAYSAAKNALLAAMRCFALELASKQIRVNAVVPGVVMTPMTEKFFSQLPPAQVENITKSHPLGVGAPEDVAAAIAFLCSDDARWITGSELVIDGGLTCK